MICKYCNKGIVDDAVFCSYCGKQIDSSNEIKYEKYYKVISTYFDEVKPNAVDVRKYFNPKKMGRMEDVFYQFAVNLQDYNMMPSVIGFLRKDRNQLFKEIFFDYDCYKVIKTYTEESLYKKFCEVFPVKNKDSKQNLWLKYSKGIIDSAELLSGYSSVQKFNDYIDSFNGSLDILYILAKKIRGVGFALASNIVKDLGFTCYAKPDTHTKDVMAATGLACNDNVDVMLSIRKTAEANGDTAYNLDRMIWLICSGYYFLDDLKVKPRKRELIQRIYEA